MVPGFAVVLYEKCVIKPGSECRVTLYGDGDVTRELVIDDAGRFDLPLIGGPEESLIGRSCDEAAQMISHWFARPSDYEPPQMSDAVGVECSGSRSVCVMGSGVANPGCYPHKGKVTVMTAIAMAGGFTYRAVQDGFVIFRDGKKIIAGPDTPVFPGDTIELRERFF